MSGGRSVFAVALACALFLPLNSLRSQSAVSPDAADRAGHQRMLRELREIADGALFGNPFFRTEQLEELRRQVANMPAGTTPGQRLQLRYILGMQEFRLGSIRAAIEELNFVLEHMPQGASLVRSKVMFYLGLAHLRLGERRNCVANHTGESCILPIRGGGVHTAPEHVRRAIEHFREVLRVLPAGSVEHMAVKWLLTIAYMAAGDYPDGVPSEEVLDPAIFTSEEDFPRLHNIAPQLGVDVVDFAGGAVIEDFDGDGLLDILTSSWGPTTPLRLFRNRGDGAFEEISQAAGLGGLTGGLNLVHADYDNDGDSDVLVLRGAWLGAGGQHPNSLLRNDGDRFTDVTFLSGLGDVHRPSQAAAWADYDNDGDLDVYIANEGNAENFPAQLFRNNGNGKFTDVAAAAGVENWSFSKAVAWGDFDGDRFPDLYVSNYVDRGTFSDSSIERYVGANRLYRNNRDGTFTDVAPQLGTTAPSSGFATWFWDFDNDGLLDLYVASFPYMARNAMNAGLDNLFTVVSGYLGIEVDAERGRLYRGNGQGGFQEVGLEQGLDRLSMPMGANFGDLDNDGFPDFYLGTGYPEYDGLVPNLLYRNDRGQRFVDVTFAAGVGHLQKGHGVVFADLDNDGDEDLFEQIGGWYVDDDFANALFENPGFGQHWLKVKLVGVDSNRSGVGARIRADIVEGGTRRSVYRTVGARGSFGSSPMMVHLGLGEADTVERLEIFWPTTDTTQSFRDVGVDRAIEVTEGAAEFRLLSLPLVQFAVSPGGMHHRE